MKDVDTATKGADDQKTGTSPSDGSQGATGQQPPQNQPTDIQKAIEKAIHDDRMKEGRDRAALEKREQAVLAKEKANQEAERAKELDELEEVKDKPEELSLVQRKQKLAADIRNHNAQLSKYQPILEAIEELGITDAGEFKKVITESRATQFELAINQAATENNIDASILKDKVKDFGLKDESSIKKLAAVLPKKTAVPPVDTGNNVGGGTDIDKLSPEEKIEWGLKHPPK